MIKHVFFDLDRTLWDFEKNSHKELMNLWAKHQLHQKGISLPEEFIRIYKRINEDCWALYRDNALTKEALRTKRFADTLEYFGILDDKVAESIGHDYITNCPYRTALFPNAFEIIDYLKSKYELHIITNGFEEVQYVKMKQSNLTEHFSEIITSEKAGAKKPHPQIFAFAADKVGASAQDCVMIGDDLLCDIQGAIDFGMQAIYFNPHKVKHNIDVLGNVQDLIEIKTFL